MAQGSWKSTKEYRLLKKLIIYLKKNINENNERDFRSQLTKRIYSGFLSEINYGLHNTLFLSDIKNKMLLYLNRLQDMKDLLHKFYIDVVWEFIDVSKLCYIRIYQVVDDLILDLKK